MREEQARVGTGGTRGLEEDKSRRARMILIREHANMYRADDIVSSVLSGDGDILDVKTESGPKVRP